MHIGVPMHPPPLALAQTALSCHLALFLKQLNAITIHCTLAQFWVS